MSDFTMFPTTLSLRDAMQRLVDDSVVPFAGARPAGATAPTLPIDLYGTDDHYTLRAALPGVLPDNVDITYHNGTLALRAAVPPQPVPQGEPVTWYRRQLWSGTLSAAIELPEPIDAERAESDFVNGVLTLTLPKAAGARPKRIAITAHAPAMVGAGDAEAAPTAQGAR